MRKTIELLEELCREYRTLEKTPETPAWNNISDDNIPDQGEQVIVITDNGTKFMQTYINGFTKGVVAWMRIPKYE